MIKEISFNNFKGKTAKYELTGKDLFYGNNATGKSAILQAVALAVQGYLPGGAKRSEDVFQYATGDTMSVRILLDNEFEFTRTWTKVRKTDKNGNETVSIAQDIHVAPSKGENTNSAKQSRIFAEVGSFLLTFDFDELNNMSDAKRRDFIYSIASFDKSKYNADFISEYLLKRSEEITNTDLLGRARIEIHALMTKYRDDENFENSLASLQEHILNRALEFKAQRLEASAASRKLMEYKNQIKETDRGLEAARAEQNEVDEKIDGMTAQYATEISQVEKAENLYRRSEDLKSRITLKDILIRENERKLEDIDEQLKTNSTSYSRKDADEKQTIIDQTNAQIASLDQSTKDLSEKIQKLESEIYYLNKEKSKYEEAVCPVNSEWKCPYDFKKSAQEIQEKVDLLYSEHKKLSEERKALTISVYNLNEKSIKERQERTRIIELIERETKQNEIASANRILYEKLLESAKDERERAIAELKQVEVDFEKSGRGNRELLEQLQIALSGYKNRRTELKQIISDKEQAKHSLTTMLRAVNESKNAEENFKICNTIYQNLGAKGVKGMIVKDILEPLEQKINEKLIKFPRYQDYQFTFISESDTGQEVFRYGWKDAKHNIVLFPALSTSEKQILTAIILSTLLETVDIETRILMFDNIENFDDDARSAFIHELAEMGEKFDNVIITGVLSDEQSEDCLSSGYSKCRLS